MNTAAQPSSVLVVGATGSIGQALFEAFSKAGRPVRGTSYRRAAPGMVPFDLLRGDLEGLLAGLAPGDPVYLLSALTSPNAVAQSPELARQLNVEASRRLASAVLKKGGRLIHVSSTQVFDGTEGGYTETSPCRPLTLYGRLKREFEEFLLGQAGDWALIRTDAVAAAGVGTNCPVEKTYQSLWQGGARMAVDNILSLTAMDDLVLALMRLALPAPSRLYHVAARPPVSRAELAERIRRLSRFGERMDFRPVEFSQLQFPEPRPRATWLDAGLLRAELGMDPVFPEDLLALKVAALDEAVELQGPWWMHPDRNRP